MKKIYMMFLSSMMVLSIVLCACQTNTHTDDNCDADNSANYVSGELKTVIYANTENSSIFNTNEKEYENFAVRLYKENISKNTIVVDVLGKNHTGIYEQTAKLPCSDTTVHVYTLEEKGRVLVDALTGSIVEYSGVPYDEKLTTESDYIGFIKKVLGENHDLNEYSYACKTHYYSRNPGEIRSQVVDGFRVCEGNESVGTYYFFYTKSEKGVALPGHISATFYGGKFTLEIYEYDYESKDFTPIINRMEEVEASVEKHLKNNVKDKCTIVSIKHDSKRIFVQDGVPYVMITSIVTYKLEFYDESGTFTVLIQSITG